MFNLFGHGSAHTYITADLCNHGGKSQIQTFEQSMTGFGDIPMTVRAMKGGADDFLAKPFREQDLLDAVQNALERDRVQRSDNDSRRALESRHATLTPRERQIMGLAASGLMNKQIAAEVGTSEITVKIHRGNAMRKMGARTFADLVRMAEALGVSVHTKV